MEAATGGTEGGEGMSTILGERHVERTRKYARCQWCSEELEKLKPSVTVSGIWDGDFSTMRLHTECHAAWKRTDWDRYDGDVWWDNVRGKAMQEDGVDR